MTVFPTPIRFRRPTVRELQRRRRRRFIPCRRRASYLRWSRNSTTIPAKARAAAGTLFTNAATTRTPKSATTPTLYARPPSNLTVANDTAALTSPVPDDAGRRYVTEAVFGAGRRRLHLAGATAIGPPAGGRGNHRPDRASPRYRAASRQFPVASFGLAAFAPIRVRRRTDPPRVRGRQPLGGPRP